MRPSSQQLQGFGRSIVDALLRADLIELPGGPEAAIAAVAERFGRYFQAAAALEEEAERLADEHLRGAPGRGAGIDRHRVVQRIKEKLAAERDLAI